MQTEDRDIFPVCMCQFCYGVVVQQLCYVHGREDFCDAIEHKRNINDKKKDFQNTLWNRWLEYIGRIADTAVETRSLTAAPFRTAHRVRQHLRGVSGRVIVAAAFLDDHIAHLPDTLIESLDREHKVEHMAKNEKKAGTIHFPLMSLYKLCFCIATKVLKRPLASLFSPVCCMPC